MNYQRAIYARLDQLLYCKRILSDFFPIDLNILNTHSSPHTLLLSEIHMKQTYINLKRSLCKINEGTYLQWSYN